MPGFQRANQGFEFEINVSLLSPAGLLPLLSRPHVYTFVRLVAVLHVSTGILHRQPRRRRGCAREVQRVTQLTEASPATLVKWSAS
jgi:hypothetical protein